MNNAGFRVWPRNWSPTFGRMHDLSIRLLIAQTLGWALRPGRLALPVPGQDAMVLEPLPAAFGQRFDAPIFDDAASDAACAIAHALARLAPCGAADAISCLVRSVHCIAARGPGDDCSHSEPTIPFSVLVSVPAGERHAELRLAESLLHEGMHLQLTLIERHVSCVGSEAGAAFSPWQQCPRPAQGLLHGLYVFTAIAQWLTALDAARTLSSEDQVYVDRRRAEIREETTAVVGLPSSEALTPFGRMLAAWLLDAMAVRRLPTA